MKGMRVVDVREAEKTTLFWMFLAWVIGVCGGLLLHIGDGLVGCILIGGSIGFFGVGWYRLYIQQPEDL